MRRRKKTRTERTLELLELKSGLVVSRRAGSLDASTGGSLEGCAGADTGEVGAVIRYVLARISTIRKKMRD